MDAQKYKRVSPKILDFRKILKFHLTNCNFGKKFYFLFYRREKAERTKLVEI